MGFVLFLVSKSRPGAAMDDYSLIRPLRIRLGCTILTASFAVRVGRNNLTLWGRISKKRSPHYHRLDDENSPST
jgi:hypothetical protein